MFPPRPARPPAAPRTITADLEHDAASVGGMLRLFGTIWARVGSVGAGDAADGIAS